MFKRFTFLLMILIGFVSSSERLIQGTAYQQPIPGSELSIEMVPIPAGVFTMGSDLNTDEQPLHEVEISSFYMSKYEVTWELYELYLQRQIDHQPTPPDNDLITIDVDAVSAATKPYLDMSYGMGKKGFPVTNVTQYAAATFCKWLSAKTDRFYRLPTEAEWEYACRAGSTTIYSFGDDVSKLGAYGWYYGNSDEKYHKVGQKKSNDWGLYDMHGNVAEWTLDAYTSDGYGSDSQQNPWNKATELYPRTLRGGSWYDDPQNLTSTARMASTKEWKRIDPQLPKSLWWHTNAPFIGFRVVSPMETPTAEVMKSYWLEPIKDY